MTTEVERAAGPQGSCDKERRSLCICAKRARYTAHCDRSHARQDDFRCLAFRMMLPPRWSIRPPVGRNEACLFRQSRPRTSATRPYRRPRVFDTSRFAQHLETAYTMMHERDLAGLAPDDFAVPASWDW